MALTNKQLENFREELDSLRTYLGAVLKGATETVKSFGETTGYSQHQADEGTDDFDRTIRLEVSGKEMGILKQVERALQKLDEGTYGFCDLTEKPISLARLKAIPYACMTVESQGRLEKGLL